METSERLTIYKRLQRLTAIADLKNKYISMTPGKKTNEIGELVTLLVDEKNVPVTFYSS